LSVKQDSAVPTGSALHHSVTSLHVKKALTMMGSHRGHETAAAVMQRAHSREKTHNRYVKKIAPTPFSRNSAPLRCGLLKNAVLPFSCRFWLFHALRFVRGCWIRFEASTRPSNP
jgi:hypothetical protein